MAGETDRSAVVTGGASGIGRAVVERLLTDGWFVVALDRNAGALATLSQAYGTRIATVVGPVEARESHRRARAAAVAQSPLQGWVGCAGVTHTRDLGALTPDHVDEVLAINQIGMLWGAAEAVDEWLTADRAGALVLISSIHGHRSAPRHAVYEMTKAATEALARNVAVAHGSAGIRAVAVAPGAVDTPALQSSLGSAADPAAAEAELLALVPLQRVAGAAEVASVVAFLLSDQASYVTGTTIAVDGGWSAAMMPTTQHPHAQRADVGDHA